MNSVIRKITGLTAALILAAAPGAALAETAGQTPAAAAYSPMQKGHPHPHGKGFRAGGYFILNETARLLDMERSEVISRLKSGTTLYALAKEKKGWSEEQYLQKLSEAAGGKVDESVKEGRLTQEEAAKLKAGLPAMLKLTISNAESFHGTKPMPGHSH
ncbi:hypothetical protein [Paenibacillus tengchongensis]|uniref:hypothetical protein n=1 Tax=Paenibacillus tengchongensis TaxID=2608684 RepID=UPI00124C48C2|nr:hypothetical protein [Paenibacillus tengchongensis]